MEILKYENIGNEGWDIYCNSISTATFNHTSDRIRYDLEYSPYIKENLSFIVIEDKIPTAVVILYIEEIAKIFQISFNNSHSVIPAINTDITYRKQEKLLKFIFESVDKIVIEYKCRKVLLRFDPLSNPEAKHKIFNFNYLLMFNFIDNSILSRLIDLRESESILLGNMRKGHKSAIKQGMKNFSFEFYNKENISSSIFDIYRVMHHKAAGRVTRPLVTFKIMNEWINHNNAILVLGKHKEDYVASILITTYKNSAYYASGAEEPDIDLPVPIGHALMWKSICFLKTIGIEFFETGWQQYGNLPYDKPSEKDLNISLYKRGFGGYAVPVFRGKKCFSIDYFSDVQQGFEKINV